MVSKSRHSRRRRLVAVFLLAVLTTGFGASFVHVDRAEHTYCREHQQITHASPDAERDPHRTERTSPPARETPDDGPPYDHEPRGCQWLTWFDSSESPLDHVTSGAFTLPLPAPLLEPPETSGHELSRAPVSPRHVSPINSPPTG